MEDLLSKIQEPVAELSTEPDKQTKLELDDILNNRPEYLEQKINQEKAKTRKLEEEITGLEDDRKARKHYGYVIFLFVAVYISLLGAFLWIIASHHDYQLSDQVLVALLISTSINMIGLLMGVVRYLFPAKKYK